MTDEIFVLSLTAASIGFLHTLLGPDHYVPFIVMAKAGKWSIFKTALITILSGIGHVLGSVVLGIIGIALGIAITEIEAIESFRGNFAGWLLISFGFVYTTWGIRKAYRNKPHNHWHKHSDGSVHNHEHTHHNEHTHVHSEEKVVSLTPWILFTIFVFGPCEALIPILMYPAANSSISGLVIVTTIFGITTILTMLLIVLISTFGFNHLSLGRFERYTHALAGLLILIAGISINFFGL